MKNIEIQDITTLVLMLVNVFLILSCLENKNYGLGVFSTFLFLALLVATYMLKNNDDDHHHLI